MRASGLLSDDDRKSVVCIHVEGDKWAKLY